jgi:hypothetical protein
MSAFDHLQTFLMRCKIRPMGKVKPTRFSVSAENEAEAVAHLHARGYAPTKIEKCKDGLIALIFAPLPDDQMFGLVQALAMHLSAKIGIVVGNTPPFRSEDRSGS